MPRLLWRLPQFDPIAFRIHDPTKFAVVVSFDAWIDFNAFAFQLREQFIQILDLKIDHERFLARREVIRVARKGRPDSVPFALRIIQLAPFKDGTTVLLCLDSKALAIPVTKLFWVIRLKENSADAGDAFHGGSVIVPRLMIKHEAESRRGFQPRVYTGKRQDAAFTLFFPHESLFTLEGHAEPALSGVECVVSHFYGAGRRSALHVRPHLSSLFTSRLSLVTFFSGGSQVRCNYAAEAACLRT
jgi:hypothetical protein